MHVRELEVQGHLGIQDTLWLTLKKKQGRKDKRKEKRGKRRHLFKGYVNGLEAQKVFIIVKTKIKTTMRYHLIPLTTERQIAASLPVREVRAGPKGAQRSAPYWLAPSRLSLLYHTALGQHHPQGHQSLRQNSHRLTNRPVLFRNFLN